MGRPENILLLHDRDLIGCAVGELIRERGLALRERAGFQRADEIVGDAFGSRAIVAVGDRFATDPAVLSAAEMPGVGALVLVVRGEPDLMRLRRKGVPYTVLRANVLLDDVVAELAAAVERGRLVIDPNDDVQIHAVSAHDVALCALAAIDEASVCGRVIELSTPHALRLVEVARRIADAREQALTISRWPKWALAALRAIGRVSYSLPDALETRSPDLDLTLLHPGPWQMPEAVVRNVERRNEHAAMGMQ